MRSVKSKANNSGIRDFKKLEEIEQLDFDQSILSK